MAGDFCWDILRKRARTALDIPALLIERRKILTKTNDDDVHAARSSLATIFFSFNHQRRAEPALLVSWINRQQPQIRSLTAKLDVHTAIQLAIHFREQENAFRQRLLNLRLPDAIAVDEELLGDTKRGVDDGSDLRRVGRSSDTDSKRHYNLNWLNHEVSLLQDDRIDKIYMLILKILQSCKN